MSAQENLSGNSDTGGASGSAQSVPQVIEVNEMWQG